MEQWLNAVEAIIIKAQHENQKDEYERGLSGGLNLGFDTIKANIGSKGAAKVGVESLYAMYESGYKSDPSEFFRGVRDGLKTVLELYR
jgi:hypothetical protein